MSITPRVVMANRFLLTTSCVTTSIRPAPRVWTGTGSCEKGVMRRFFVTGNNVSPLPFPSCFSSVFPASTITARVFLNVEMVAAVLECSGTTFHSFGKISFTKQSINDVPRLRGTANDVMTPNQTRMQRTPNCRRISITPSTSTAC